MNSRVRNYSFTINNYTNDDEDRLSQIDSEYLIYGREKGEHGTPHLQGFVRFKHAKSFTAVKKLLPRAHIEVSVSSVEDNVRYCSKDGDVVEYGKKPSGQGKRKDICEIKKCIQEQKKIKYMLQNNIITNYQGLKYAEGLQKYFEGYRDWPTKVEWFYGATGTGKSREAFKQFTENNNRDNVYVTMDTGRWWDGYDGHSHVIIDDIRRDFMKFHQFLRLLDQNEFRVETKGGSRQFLARHIIITCPYHPKELYETREDVEQLLRRIDNIREFK